MNDSTDFLTLFIIIFIIGYIGMFIYSDNGAKDEYSKDEYSKISLKIYHSLQNNMSDSQKLQIIEEKCKIYTANTAIITYKYCFEKSVKQFILE